MNQGIITKTWQSIHYSMLTGTSDRWDAAMSTARWDRRDAVYMEAVRERQNLRQELRDRELSGERTSRALTLANVEVDRLREAMRQQQEIIDNILQFNDRRREDDARRKREREREADARLRAAAWQQVDGSAQQSNES